MNRQDYINKIIKFSARFVEEVASFNALGLYDINIHSENFYLPVLNQIFDLNLENLNKSVRKNYPSIDLADFKSRVAFQITATSTTAKIKDTIEKFKKYKLYKKFGTLFIYIITEKKSNYSDSRFSDALPDQFHFTVKEHILDNNDLIERINGLDTEKLSYLSKIYQQEFSDVQIELRHNKYRFGCLSGEGEKIFINALNVKIPSELYVADIDIDEESIQGRINDWRVSKGKHEFKRRLPKVRLINSELAHNKANCSDWLCSEGKLFTFRNLNDSREPLAKIIDKGTITPMSCDEYYNQNENTLRIFKNLLRNALIEDCYSKELEWVRKKKLLRFRMNKDQAGSKSIRWKGKNWATKTVISEIRNKKEGHLISYRHLAFHPAFEFIDNNWNLIINSSWSFTNPGGRYVSKYEESYLSGIKRLENNQTIFNFFRFWSYYLRYKDLFSKENPILKFEEILPTFLIPKLEDSSWKPAREEISQVETKDVIIEKDNELTLNLFD